MRSYTNQYTLLFFLSWVVLFLIYPVWALPVSVVARAALFFGLLTLFLAASYLMTRLFVDFPVDKPFIVIPEDFAASFRDNLWLVVVCLTAAAFHIPAILRPILIMGDEPLHLQGGLLIYDYIDFSWHRSFQIAIWALFILFLLLINAKHLNKLNLNRFAVLPDRTKKRAFICSLLFLLISYFYVLRDIPYKLMLIRYPPVSKYLYLAMYSAFGVNHIFPRFIQLLFYLLCGVYLYRTIMLFEDKRTAILGASIYLFFPVIFAYANLAETASGLNLFIFAISFYFIRYLKEADHRDLFLTSYLIGTGLLYKDPVLLMFIISLSFLVMRKFLRHDLRSLHDLKVLSLSLIFIVPWMVISKLFNTRNYTFVLSNITSLNGNLIKYLALLSSNLSWIIFALFFLSVFYVIFFKRNVLTLYFACLFIIYYLFTVSDIAWVEPRLSMTFYPTIAVFLSLFISRGIETINRRHIFKIFYSVFTLYLIILCTVPPFNNQFLAPMNKKLHYYPSKEAASWVKENIKDGEKILMLRILPFDFYLIKYGIDGNRIINLSYDISEVSTPEKLKKLTKEHNAGYIMFPYGPPYSFEGERKIIRYLKDDNNNEFAEIAKFNIDECFIYVYKLKDG
ncbi:MAG: glycosyltransferase family 39 protein [Nitrospirae bacterium]|nr:glycosyltransferase family 39 protein [Nitrospirota bacterium]